MKTARNWAKNKPLAYEAGGLNLYGGVFLLGNATIGCLVVVVAIVLAFSFPIVGIPLLIYLVFFCAKQWRNEKRNNHTASSNDDVDSKVSELPKEAAPTLVSFGISSYVRSGYNLEEYSPDLSPEEQGFRQVIPTRRTPTISKKTYHPDSFVFEDEHEKDINRWRKKIERAEDSIYDCDSPDKKIKTFEKTLALCDDFRNYCYTSSGVGGVFYYDDNESDVEEHIEKSFRDYIDNEYEVEKSEYVEKQKEMQLYSSSKRKIYDAILVSENGMTRKEIYALFSPDKQRLVLKALNELVNEGKVHKDKQGKKLVFTI